VNDLRRARRVDPGDGRPKRAQANLALLALMGKRAPPRTVRFANVLTSLELSFAIKFLDAIMINQSSPSATTIGNPEKLKHSADERIH
jgi:hypothetical protein